MSDRKGTDHAAKPLLTGSVPELEANFDAVHGYLLCDEECAGGGRGVLWVELVLSVSLEEAGLANTLKMLWVTARKREEETPTTVAHDHDFSVDTLLESGPPVGIHGGISGHRGGSRGNEGTRRRVAQRERLNVNCGRNETGREGKGGREEEERYRARGGSLHFPDPGTAATQTRTITWIGPSPPFALSPTCSLLVDPANYSIRLRERLNTFTEAWLTQSAN
jgi:hypothetical protein